MRSIFFVSPTGSRSFVRSGARANARAMSVGDHDALRNKHELTTASLMAFPGLGAANVHHHPAIWNKAGPFRRRFVEAVRGPRSGGREHRNVWAGRYARQRWGNATPPSDVSMRSRGASRGWMFFIVCSRWGPDDLFAEDRGQRGNLRSSPESRVGRVDRGRAHRRTMRASPISKRFLLQVGARLRKPLVSISTGDVNAPILRDWAGTGECAVTVGGRRHPPTTGCTLRPIPAKQSERGPTVTDRF